MTRLRKLLILTGLVATLAAPAIAVAQPGDRAATQLFLGPTGRVLPKGQGYFKSVSVTVPFVQGGVTDRFSMGFGVPLVALGQGVLVTPKFQIQRSARHSTSIGAVEFVSTFGSGGVAYVAHTIELEKNAVHVALIKPIGVGFSEPRAAAVMLGGEHRVSDRVTFITENYVLGYGPPVLSAGVRIKNRHTTCDLGWLVPFGYHGTPGAPMINVGWRF